MFAKFDLEKWKKLPIKDKPESIFDITYAGQVAEDGKYYCILWSYEKKQYYAVLATTCRAATETWGHSLSSGEMGQFHNEFVRAMTQEEEIADNCDMLDAKVDMWGNVALDLQDVSYTTLAKLLRENEEVTFNGTRDSVLLQSLKRAGLLKDHMLVSRYISVNATDIETEQGKRMLRFIIRSTKERNVKRVDALCQKWRPIYVKKMEV